MNSGVDLFIRLAVVLMMIMWPFSSPANVVLKEGDAAPDFELIDQYRNVHKLSDYAGKWVVLYFYPKNGTPGCTTEACNFRDDIFKIRALNAEVLGVSLDSTESHASFAEKHGLPFPLLSDAGKEVTGKYGTLMSIGPIKTAKRHTFIIDPEGRLAKIYRRVDPDTHSAEVIADLTDLTQR